MTITTETQGNSFRIKLDGWLDTLSSPELGKEIEKITTADAIILDFDKVEYIASSGLREVVACSIKAKSIGAELSIENVCSDVFSIFSMTGLDKKLSIKTK